MIASTLISPTGDAELIAHRWARGRDIAYLITVENFIRYKRHFLCETAVISTSWGAGMDTARAARAHFIWTSIALVFILIASCLIYVFMSKVNISDLQPQSFRFFIWLDIVNLDNKITLCSGICGTLWRITLRLIWLNKSLVRQFTISKHSFFYETFLWKKIRSSVHQG